MSTDAQDTPAGAADGLAKADNLDIYESEFTNTKALNDELIEARPHMRQGNWLDYKADAEAYIDALLAACDALRAERDAAAAALADIRDFAEGRQLFYQQPEVTGNRARNLIEWRHLQAMAVAASAANSQQADGG